MGQVASETIITYHTHLISHYTFWEETDGEKINKGISMTTFTEAVSVINVMLLYSRSCFTLNKNAAALHNAKKVVLRPWTLHVQYSKHHSKLAFQQFHNFVVYLFLLLLKKSVIIDKVLLVLIAIKYLFQNRVLLVKAPAGS